MGDCRLQLFTNNGISLLNTDISATDLTIQLDPGAGSGFPQPTNTGEWFVVTIEDGSAPVSREIVKIIDRVGDTLIVDPVGRGWEGTTAQAWTAGNVIVDHRITAGTLYCFQEMASPIPNDVETGLSVVINNTETANSMDITGLNKTCKWLVTVKTADGRIAMTEVLAVNKDAPASPIFTEYARVGDRIKFETIVSNTPTEMKLNIKNNDISDFIEVDVIRLQHF